MSQEAQMHPFPSIKQFRNVVAHVGRKASFKGLDEAGEPILDHTAKAPTLSFYGTVKLHGTNAAVNVEAMETLQAFVAQTVTEARLTQGLQNLVNEQGKPFEMTSLSDFIRWVHGDVIKEEADTLQASGIDPKKIGGPIAQVAKRWYVEKLNQETFKKAT